MKNNNRSSHGQFFSVFDTADLDIVESYKTLRTNIMFALPSIKDNACRKILIASQCSGDGKTTTAVNLSLTLAETGKKVLLIDADLRNPDVYKYFGMKITCGLSNLLSGMNKQEECIQNVNGVPGLSVINAGMLPPNPCEMLASQAMLELVGIMADKFDYIIFDSPALEDYADALELIKYSDGTALVISQNHSTIPELSKAISSLKFANANIIGIIMNKAKRSVHRGSRRSGSLDRGRAFSAFDNDEQEDDE